MKRTRKPSPNSWSVCYGIIAALLAASPPAAMSQSTSFIHYGIREGLPSAEVYQVFQDSKGFMWFPTDNGVVRFDGTSMQNIKGLPDPVVFGAFEDTRHRIWLRSYSGQLVWYADQKIHLYPYNDTLIHRCKRSLLRSFSADSSGAITFNTEEFNGKITADGRVLKMTYDSTSSDYWKSGNDCIVKWKNKTFVSFDKFLFEIRNNKMHLVYTGHDAIISMFADTRDALWLGYRSSNCERFRTSTFENPDTPDFLAGKGVSSVMQDNAGGYWISTLTDGVYYVPDFRYVRMTLRELSHIRLILTSRHGVLLSDDQGKLALMNVQTLGVERNGQLPTGSVVAGYTDSRDRFWISSKGILSILDSTLRSVKEISIHTRGFYESKTQGMLAFDQTRLMSFDKSMNISKAIALNDIHRSILGSDPYVIMAGRTGIDIYDSTYRLIRSPQEFKNFKISVLANLNDTTLLVATIGNGFFVLNKRTWVSRQFILDKGFMSNNVYAALVNDSILWLGTERGVAIAPVRTVLTGNPTFTFLNKKSGLADNKIDQMVKAGKDVWIFTGNEFSVIPADQRVLASEQTSFYFKDLLVNDISCETGKTLELSSGENRIKIDFGFIDYRHAEIYVRSRLSKNSPWSFTTERSLTYDRLAPGDYILELEYSADNSKWSPASTGVRFSISAPWYQRWYFQLAILLLIVLIGLIFYRIRISMLVEKNLRLKLINDHRQTLLHAEIETMERERSRIAKDLHDGAGMGLTVLKIRIHQIFRDRANEAREIIDFLNTSIQEIRDSIYNLTPSGLSDFGLTNSLRAYIQKTASDLDVCIDIYETGPEILDPRVSLSLFRILQELITNSLKHSSGTRITIHVSSLQHEFRIMYKDNGHGFTRGEQTSGTGLLNIEARVEHIKGKMELVSGPNGVQYEFVIPHEPIPQEPQNSFSQKQKT